MIAVPDFQRILRYAWWMTIPLCLFMLLSPMEWLLTSTVYDDAFYYFEIAHNIVEGRGSTFDGFTSTNGYHPLWMMVVVVIRLLVTDKVLLVHIAASISALLAVSSWVVFGYLLKGYYESPTPLRLLSFFLFPILFFFAVYGLETWLSILLLLLFMRSVFKEEIAENPARQGLLASAAVLARLDLVIPVAVFLLLQCVVLRRKGRLSHIDIFVWSIPVFLSIGGYMLCSYHYFGLLRPISAIVKATSTLPQPGGYPGLLPRFMDLLSNSWMLVIVVAVIITLAASIWLYRKDRHRLYHFGLPIAAVIHIGLLVSTTVWGEMIWYFFPHIIGAVFALPALDSAWQRLAPSRKIRIVSVLCVPIFMYTLMIQGKLKLDAIDYTSIALYEASGDLRTHLPSGSSCGTPFAGIVGYFSGRDVLDMDGLVTDESYLKSAANGDIPAFLEAHGVQYLLIPVHGGIDIEHYIPYLSARIEPKDILYSTRFLGPHVPRWVLIRFTP